MYQYVLMTCFAHSSYFVLHGWVPHSAAVPTTTAESRLDILKWFALLCLKDIHLSLFCSWRNLFSWSKAGDHDSWMDPSTREEHSEIKVLLAAWIDNQWGVGEWELTTDYSFYHIFQIHFYYEVSFWQKCLSCVPLKRSYKVKLFPFLTYNLHSSL